VRKRKFECAPLTSVEVERLSSQLKGIREIVRARCPLNVWLSSIAIRIKFEQLLEKTTLPEFPHLDGNQLYGLNGGAIPIRWWWWGW